MKYRKTYLFVLIQLLLLASLAFGHGILPALVARGGGGGATQSWANWTATSETTLSVNQGGGTNNTHVMWLENTVAGGDETGTGYDDGADLVWTQTGNLAGAAGSPSSRTFDGLDDALRCTQPLSNIVTGTKFTVAILLEDYPQVSENIFVFRDAAGNNYLFLGRGGASFNKLNIVVIKAGGVIIQQNTVDDLPAAGKYWLFVCCDGTNTYAGFVISTGGSGAGGQPTKWSDIPANQRRSAVATVGYGANTFNSAANRGIAEEGATFAAAKVYCVVLSSTNLVDYNS